MPREDVNAALAEIDRLYQLWQQDALDDEGPLIAAFEQLVAALEHVSITGEEKWATERMLQAWAGPDTETGADELADAMRIFFSAWRIREPG